MNLLSTNKFLDEKMIIKKALSSIEASNSNAICNDAISLVTLCRKNKKRYSRLDNFLSEYGLNNSEGIALMCLAESLLRIPDKSTRDEIIKEKITHAKWQDHINKSESLLVNASTWGLLLAGKVISPKKDADWLAMVLNTVSKDTVREAVIQGMHILSREFVCASKISELDQLNFNNNQSYSFDMLGEGARADFQAISYLNQYIDVIKKTSEINNLHNINNNVSIKISALFPHYFARKDQQITKILYPRLLQLCETAQEHNVSLTIDAEEQDRLHLSMKLIQSLSQETSIKHWQGLGVAIQAYGKRAQDVITLISEIAIRREKMHVRLVKGAYWDYEIKQAQVKGYMDFPVFTHKAFTDVNYLSCAHQLFNSPNLNFYFATHNAHTIASIYHMGRGRQYEFQRLYGMGALLFDQAKNYFDKFPAVSIYAPVGKYEDLLPYLVRRLLENGANSSFVNRVMHRELSPSEVISDPIKKSQKMLNASTEMITKPLKLFTNRKNSNGLDLADPCVLDQLQKNLLLKKENKIHVSSCSTLQVQNHEAVEYLSKADQSVLGRISLIDQNSIIQFNDLLPSRSWVKTHITDRAKLLNQVSDLIEKNPEPFIYLLIHESGKVVEDAIDEIRECVDLLRYYASQSESLTDLTLSGPTGELNQLKYYPKGIALCISPWNFPLAIMCGQIAANLVVGNTVIAKSSELTPAIAYYLVDLFYQAGLPKDALHLILGDRNIGQALVALDCIDVIAFTGSLTTAKHIHASISQRDGALLPLVAETGGLNAMIVDSSALLEQACDAIIRSAFSSAGQRCSALRILLVHHSIKDRLWNLLVGAMNSLVIGNPCNFGTDIGPIISEASKIELTTYIKQFKKKGVNFFHHSNNTQDTLNLIPPTLIEINSLADINDEKFGPILHFMSYKKSDLNLYLKELQAKGFGLTLGIQSRIDSQIQNILEQLNVGNSYVNRDMVGAVVESQPFGGIGKSGIGFKAGGPNYLKQFANERTVTTNTVAVGGNAELLNTIE